MKNLNSKILGELEVLDPPFKLKEKFITILEKYEFIKTIYQNGLIGIENLYGSLSQKAFKGELDLSNIPLPENDGVYDYLEHQEELNKAFTEGLPPEVDEDMTYDSTHKKFQIERSLDYLLRERKGKKFTFKDLWDHVALQALDGPFEVPFPTGEADYNAGRENIVNFTA